MKYCSNVALASAVFVTLLSSCSHADRSTQLLHDSQVQPIQSLAKSKVSERPANATVKIRNFKFVPATIKIKVGETVQFVNSDEEPHTVTASDGSFDSKGLDTNQAWMYTFTKAGNFDYICAIHPYMKGTIIVTTTGE